MLLNRNGLKHILKWPPDSGPQLVWKLTMANIKSKIQVLGHFISSALAMRETHIQLSGLIPRSPCWRGAGNQNASQAVLMSLRKKGRYLELLNSWLLVPFWYGRLNREGISGLPTGIQRTLLPLPGFRKNKHKNKRFRPPNMSDMIHPTQLLVTRGIWQGICSEVLWRRTKWKHNREDWIRWHTTDALRM